MVPPSVLRDPATRRDRVVAVNASRALAAFALHLVGRYHRLWRLARLCLRSWYSLESVDGDRRREYYSLRVRGARLEAPVIGIGQPLSDVMHPLIDEHRAEILAIAKRHGLRDVRVFGSMARGDAGDDSDVDLLVTLPPEKTGLALGGMLMDVQTLLNRRVDVVTEKGLHPLMRDRVLREAEPL